MFKNRFLLVLGVFSLLLVTMAVSRPFSSELVSSMEGANDFYQRHRNWNRNLEGSDYYERHSELNGSAISIADIAGDFALRHPEWTISVQNSAIPVTGVFEASDYFQRHPELSLTIESAANLSDYFVRHPELRTPATIDLSDYFIRH
jgi:cobalamin biosynthesis Mg chelatase CobN